MPEKLQVTRRTIRHLSVLVAISILNVGPTLALAQTYFEPRLSPGVAVRNVRAIACNTEEQIRHVLKAYSESYLQGRRTFDAMLRVRAFDAAADRMAPVCDEMWFTAVIPIRTASTMPYQVHFADGSIHRRYIIEVKPVAADGLPAKASYFISSRWPVLTVGTAL